MSKAIRICAIKVVYQNNDKCSCERRNAAVVPSCRELVVCDSVWRRAESEDGKQQSG